MAQAFLGESVENKGMGRLCRDWLCSLEGLSPLFHPSFLLSEARKVSSCSSSCTGSSSRTATAAGICLEELLGLQRWLIPKEKATLKGMLLPWASHTLTLLRGAAAPRGGRGQGVPGVPTGRRRRRRRSSHGVPAPGVGGGDDAAGAEIPQSQAGGRWGLEQWK